MKLLVILGLILLSLISAEAVSPARRFSQNRNLPVTAREFFSTWLLRRNTEGAMKYISDNPILGTCMTPDYLEKKDLVSSNDIREVFRRVLSSTLETTRDVRNLSEVIDSLGGISSKDNNVSFLRNPMAKYFQIFRLKPGKDPNDIAYICKFDERDSFREQVSRPNVYYLVTRVKCKDSVEPIQLELLWVKEREGWRILTMAMLED